MQKAELVIIGGGPAGLAAAQAAREAGLGSVIVIERNTELGGILPQCIHNGFGLERFKEDLTGPEYARRYINDVMMNGVTVMLDTMVLGLDADRKITAVSSEKGIFELSANAVVLAMGCRERTRGAIGIPGTRPAGIMTAGTAQRFINIHGYMPGRKIVVLGSGDVGLIMARRLALEGAVVPAVLEIRPYLTGLLRNRIQCLDDFGIPLKLKHTVTRIHGAQRLDGVTVSEVDDSGKPIQGTEERLECDTLLTSVGLIPENELSKDAGVVIDDATGGPLVDQYMMTTVPGIFACGNVLLVNDLVDDVSKQGALAGTNAASFNKNELPAGDTRCDLVTGRNVYSLGPQRFAPGTSGVIEPVELYIRVKEPEDNVGLQIMINNDVVTKKNIGRVTPGEMVKAKLKLTDEQLKTLRKEQHKITIDIKPLKEGD